MKKLQHLSDFYNNNFIDFHPIYPDAKLTALRKGLGDYFETYNIWIDGFYEYLDPYSNPIRLSEAKGHDYLMRYFSSITFIHLSFEHFIIEVLENKSPILSKLNLDKQFDLINILTGKVSTDDVSNRKNVDYTIALSRIEELIKNHSLLQPEFQIDEKFHFLLEHIHTLRQLASLRNDIIHFGKRTLKKYIYECFFVNQLLPLIREYIKVQNPGLFLERNLHCKMNVIDEISRYKLPEDYEDFSNFNSLERTLRRVNHFKELGRASYLNPINMMEDILNEEQRCQVESGINKRERQRVNIHVKFRQETLGHYEVHDCPCCGTHSLTTFDYWTVTANQKTRVEKAECIMCTYKIGLNIGEPAEFGIMETELFKFVEDKES